MLSFDDRDRESVERDLLAADEEVRRLAVERVEALPRDQVVPKLVECLGDPSWRVRKAAVSRLVAWPDAEQATALLIAALHDGDNPGRRNAAVDALVQSGRSALPLLIEATEVEDPDVRKFVVDVLAGIGDDQAVDTLVALLSDLDVNVRGSAADALGAIGGDRAELALREAVTDASQPSLVRFSALHALDNLESPVRSGDLGAALSETVLRPAALALLGRAEDDAEAVEILVKSLAADTRSCREAAIRSLLRVLGGVDVEDSQRVVERVRAEAQAEPQAIDGALERLPDADLTTQLVLIQFLGLVGQGRAAVPILEAGEDEALEPVALSALTAMGRAAELAIDAAWDDLDEKARRSACVLFARMEGDESRGRLLEALNDPDTTVRSAAARSTGSRELEGAVDPLVGLLERAALDGEFDGEEERLAVGDALVELAGAGDGSLARRLIERLAPLLEAEEPVRLAAAIVIGAVGRSEDAETLALLLRDASAQVRRVAVDALARIDASGAADALHLAVADEAPMVRVAAAAALGGCDAEGVLEDLARLAEDPDPSVRAAAVRAAARRLAAGLNPEPAERALNALRRACDDSAQVALAAVEAIREVGGPALAYGMALLRRPEPDVVREAVRCVALHGDDQGLDDVVPLVAHADWSVRAEAIQTLASRRVHRAVPAILRRLDTEQDEYVRSVTLRALQRLES
jgi:HEAT repeat protein